MAIMTFHLAACSLYIVMTFCNIVLHMGTFGVLTSWSPLWQFSMIGYNIIGITIILLGMLGVVRRMDVAVRLYLGYLLVTFVVDTAFLTNYVLFENGSCDTASGYATTALMGHAFMCGFMRIMSFLFVASIILTEVYCLFVVWSLCEDVHEGASGPGLWELLPGKEEAFERKEEQMNGEREGPYGDIVGLMYYSKLPSAYPAPYGAFESGCCSIFGGEQHEMNYPPGPEYAGW